MNLYVMRNKKVFGPMKPENVKELYTTGQLHQHDQVGGSRVGPWKTILEILDINNDGKISDEEAKAWRQPPGQRPSLPTSKTKPAPPPIGSPPSHPKRPPSRPAVNKDAPPLRSPTPANTTVEKAYENFARNLSRGLEETDDSERIVIEQSLIIGRSSKQADWLVTDPTVSPRHAEIFWLRGSLHLQNLHSNSATILNHKRIGGGKYQLAQSDIIQIGSTIFTIEGRALVVLSKKNHAHLVCQNVSKDVNATDGSGTLRILHGINLNIEPNSFVVLLGPSGFWKIDAPQCNEWTLLRH